MPGATLVGGLTWAGNQDISEGQVIYVLPEHDQPVRQRTTIDASIDGLDIRGGDQMGFPGNLNAIFGGFPGPAEGVNVETQGGAIFANAYANYLQITNNIVENNGGSYGTIRIGTPNIDASINNNHECAYCQQPHHRQRRHEPGRRDRSVRRLRQL